MPIIHKELIFPIIFSVSAAPKVEIGSIVTFTKGAIFIFLNCPFTASFSLFSSFQYLQLTVNKKMSDLKVRRWLDLNLGPQALETITLPTEPQPVWPDLAIYWTYGNFSRPGPTISLLKSPTFFGKFVKVSTSYIFLVKLFMGNFYRQLATFYWSHWATTTVCLYV